MSGMKKDLLRMDKANGTMQQLADVHSLPFRPHLSFEVVLQQMDFCKE